MDNMIDIITSSNDNTNHNGGCIYILFLSSIYTVKTFVQISNTSGSFTAILTTNDDFGFSISSIDNTLYGDIDGDNIQDMFVGSVNDNSGVIYLIMLHTLGNVKTYQNISKTLTTSLNTLTVSGFGSCIACNAYDVNNDGFYDIIVGAYQTNNDGTAYILTLTHPPLSTSISPTITPTQYPTISPTPIPLYGIITKYKISNTSGSFTEILTTSQEFSTSISYIKDIDQDGIDDICAGVISDDGGTSKGGIYVLLMTSQGSVNTFIKISATSGSFNGILDNNDRFGSSVCNMDDIDSDGVTDITTSAVRDDDGANNSGCLYILLLQTNGNVKTFVKISNTQGSLNYFLEASVGFGETLSLMNDIDDDNISELLVGVSNDNNAFGSVFILYLKTNQKIKTYIRINKTSSNLTTLLITTNFGRSVSIIGGYNNDLDKDDYNDIIVGIHESLECDAGCVYIIFLSSLHEVKTYVEISATSGSFTSVLENKDLFGISCSYIDRLLYGDIDGDDIQDILVGAILDDDGGFNRGCVYIIMLNTLGVVKTFSKISSISSNFDGFLTDQDLFGTSVSSFGNDYNGDGYIDIIVGASDDDDGGDNTGALYIFSILHPDLTVSLSPTLFPTFSPTLSPTLYPTFTPTTPPPTSHPTTNPTIPPSLPPTIYPTLPPSLPPTTSPTSTPTIYPTLSPTLPPTLSPTRSSINIQGQLTITSYTTLQTISTSSKQSVDLIPNMFHDDSDDIHIVTGLSSTAHEGDVYIITYNNTITEQPQYQSILNTYIFPDSFGTAVCNMNDIDNDLIKDIAVSASEQNHGTVYLITLTHSLHIKSYHQIDSTTTNLLFLTTLTTFGSDISMIHDWNDDNIQDLVIGYTNNNEGGYVIITLSSTNQVMSSFHFESSTISSTVTLTLTDSITFGFSIDWLCDINNDEIPDLIVGSPRDDNNGVVYICLLQPDGNTQEIQSITSTDVHLTTVTNQFGFAVSSFGHESGDINNDGVVDIMTSAIKWEQAGGSTNIGTVYIIYLNSKGSLKTYSEIVSTSTLLLSSNNVYFGSSLVSLGYDNLFKNDLLNIVTGATGSTKSFYYISLSGSPTLSPTTVPPMVAPTFEPIINGGTIIVDAYSSLSSTTLTSTTIIFDTGDQFGSDISTLFDFDDNTIHDILIGASGDDDGSTNAGAVYIFLLTTGNQVKTYAKISFTSPSSNSITDLTSLSHFGHSVTWLSDINSDDIVDIAIGAPQFGSQQKGAVFIINLKANLGIKGYKRISSTSSVLSLTNTLDDILSDNDSFGSSISYIGDLNEDTIQDLLVGASGHDHNKGACYILYLTTNLDINEYYRIDDSLFTTSLLTDSYFGSSVSFLGGRHSFLDTDQYKDFVIGAYGVNTLYTIFWNETSGSIKSYTSFNTSIPLKKDDGFGSSISSFGFDYTDLNSDNITDIMVGAFHDDDGYIDAGAVYILYMQTNGHPITYSKLSSSSIQSTTSQLFSTSGYFGSSITSSFDHNDTFLIYVGIVNSDSTSLQNVGSIGALSVIGSPTPGPTLSPSSTPTSSPTPLLHDGTCPGHCEYCSYSDINICVICVDGYYMSSDHCKLCDESCERCSGSGSNECIECSKGYWAIIGQCFNSDFIITMIITYSIFIAAGLYSLKIAIFDTGPHTNSAKSRFNYIFTVGISLFDFGSDLLFATFGRFDPYWTQDIALLLLFTPTIAFAIHHRNGLFQPKSIFGKIVTSLGWIWTKDSWWRKFDRTYLHKEFNGGQEGIIPFLILYPLRILVWIVMLSLGIISAVVGGGMAFSLLLIVVNATLTGSVQGLRWILGNDHLPDELVHLAFNSSYLYELLCESLPQICLVLYLSVNQSGGDGPDPFAIITILGSFVVVIHGLTTIVSRILIAGDVGKGLRMNIFKIQPHGKDDLIAHSDNKTTPKRRNKRRMTFRDITSARYVKKPSLDFNQQSLELGSLSFDLGTLSRPNSGAGTSPTSFQGQNIHFGNKRLSTKR